MVVLIVRSSVVALLWLALLRVSCCFNAFSQPNPKLKSSLTCSNISISDQNPCYKFRVPNSRMPPPPTIQNIQYWLGNLSFKNSAYYNSKKVAYAPLTLSFEDNPLALAICETFGVDRCEGGLMNNNKKLLRQKSEGDNHRDSNLTSELRTATVNEGYVWFFLCLTMYPFCSSDSPSGN